MQTVVREADPDCRCSAVRQRSCRLRRSCPRGARRAHQRANRIRRTGCVATESNEKLTKERTTDTDSDDLLIENALVSEEFTPASAHSQLQLPRLRSGVLQYGGIRRATSIHLWHFGKAFAADGGLLGPGHVALSPVPVWREVQAGASRRGVQHPQPSRPRVSKSGLKQCAELRYRDKYGEHATSTSISCEIYLLR
ncbi:MAG: hypothetical protein JWQ49_614 [Edaphobacter sp.]|jgi:hypothetical protein|nr:hypothetical protein [Edaphobacter sp.]